jgi:hypothetical protein
MSAQGARCCGTDLFLVRLHSTSISRLSSSWRPITGSSLPSAARAVRSREYLASTPGRRAPGGDQHSTAQHSTGPGSQSAGTATDTHREKCPMERCVGERDRCPCCCPAPPSSVGHPAGGARHGVLQAEQEMESRLNCQPPHQARPQLHVGCRMT